MGNNHKYTANMNSSFTLLTFLILFMRGCVCVCVSAPWWLYLAMVPSPGSLIVNELNSYRCAEDEHIGSASPLCVSLLPLRLMSYKQ